MYGTVEFFNNVDGWGKIVVANTGEPLFVHHRDIKDPKFFPKDDIEKFRTLKRGQTVMFDIESNDKPMNAAIGVVIVKVEEMTSDDKSMGPIHD